MDFEKIVAEGCLRSDFWVLVRGMFERVFKNGVFWYNMVYE